VTSLKLWPLSGWWGWVTSKVPSARSAYAVVDGLGQRARGTQFSNGAGPVGEGSARGRGENPGAGQRLSGSQVHPVVEPDDRGCARQIWQIARSDIRAGLRGGVVRVEVRLDDSLAVRFGKRYVAVTQCQPRPKVASPKARPKRKKAAASRAKSQWMKNFRLTRPLGKEHSLAASLSYVETRQVSNDYTIQVDNQPGKNRSVGNRKAVSASRRQTNSVGRARTARPSSRLIYPKTAARRNHQSRWVPENQNPQNGQHWARFDWGFGAICCGAIPVAAVFGSAPRNATSQEHQIQHKSTLTPDPSKQDISTWQEIGHFYLALTAVSGPSDSTSPLSGGRSSTGDRIRAAVHPDSLNFSGAIVNTTW
jgi:hypothetical protein